MKNYFVLLMMFVCSLFVGRATASGGLGASMQTLVENTFFESGRVSAQKIEAFKSDTDKAQRENEQWLVNYYVHVGQKSQEDALKKARSSSLLSAYERLDSILSELRNASGSQAYDLGAAALHVGYAVRSEGRRMDYEEIAGYAKGVFKRYQVKRRNSSQSEASNLWNPKESRFYRTEELTRLKAEGADLSLLNPLGNGAYWTNVDVNQQTMDRTIQKSSSLYQGIDFEFPADGSTLQFDEVKRSQSRPKFDVTWMHNGKKRKFKFKFLSETHSEVTAATLLSALGFNTDPSRRINNVKVRFKDGEKVLFHRDMESYYSYWELQFGIAEDGRDEQGDFIVFKEALLEGRSEDLIRVGAWSYTKNGHPDAREVRALPVFMAWIANNDMKESGQNKSILRKNSSVDQVFFANGDLGWAFGNFVFPESVGWFKWNIIKDVRPDSVSFNYLTWLYSDLFQFTTWDDARWMIRLIARLSRDQIVGAVRAGQWDPSVEKVLVEKLIARRNQLVKVFELEKDFPAVSANESVAASDEVSDDALKFPDGSGGSGGSSKQDKILAVVQSMSKPFFEYLSPSLMSIQATLINSALDRAFKPVTEWRLTGDDLAGTGLPFAAGIILRVHRSVVRNEQPRNMNERYLVHDQLVIGWTLGTNIAQVGSSVTYYRSFNLIYPVQRQSEGMYKTAYLPALLMPYAPGQIKLPQKYSILIEDYVEGRGTLSATGHAPVELNAGASLARVYLKRTLISDRADGKVEVLLDNSHYTELSAKVAAVLRVAFVSLKFPFFEGSIRKGSIDREVWTLPVQTAESRLRAREALSLIAATMRTDTLPSFATRKQIDADFLMRKWGFNLFSLVTTLDVRTKANIEETDSESPKDIIYKYQIENVTENLWKAPILDIQERDTAKTFFLGVKSPDGKYQDAILGLNIRQWDSSTSSQELYDDSVVLAQKVAADPNFIVFSPSLHTNKDQWGSVVTMVDLLLYQAAMDKLLAISEEQWWSQFSLMTKIVPSQRRDDTRSATEVALVRNFQDFLAALSRAKNTSDLNRRIEALTNAMAKTAVTTSLTTGFKGDLVGVLMSQLPEDSYFLSVKISSPLYSQNIFPTEKPLVNRRGVLKFKDARLHDFSLNTISVIYNFFDSVIPVGSTVPSLDFVY